ncbi:TPA: hypothetical protein ACTC1Q_001904 [Neisseria meningitidis]
MPSENLSDGIFYQSSHIFFRAAKFIRNNRNHPAVIPAKAGI